MPDVVKILPANNVMGHKPETKDINKLLDKLEQLLIDMEKGGNNGEMG